jgi:hypothetical protein
VLKLFWPCLALILTTLAIGCEQAEQGKISPHSSILAPLTDPAKLDTLAGVRAATPRLRKACYWLEIARSEGAEPLAVIEAAQRQNGSHGTARARAVAESLARNRTILERLGCLDAAGMAKLRAGKAPTVTLGPYKGEIAPADPIIPRSVAPELDSRLYNLEFMPETLNQRKGAKIGLRQIQLARKWSGLGLLSDAGLSAVEGAYAPPPQ